MTETWGPDWHPVIVTRTIDHPDTRESLQRRVDELRQKIEAKDAK